MKLRMTTPLDRSLPWHRSRQRWLRHLLLTLSLAVVTLSVVGMHQLSVGHEVATGRSGTHAHPHADTAASAAAHHGQEAMPEDGVSGPAAAPAGTGGARDGCPGCGGHELAFGSCLLAFTLLVLAWTLLPPRRRQLPPSPTPRSARATAPPLVGRLAPALSLPELSLRRT